MRPERYSYRSARSSTKLPTQRIIVALLFITGVTLLMLAKSQHPMLLGARSTLLDMTQPVFSALGQPVSAARGMLTDIGAVFGAAEENKKLAAENDTLRHWQSVAMTLKAENESLRALAGYQPVERVSYATAKIIAAAPQSFSHMLTINAGAAAGLAPLQPVIDAHGLIGRVVEVGKSSSQVMLLSDVGSRLPVITGHSRSRAILTGTGSDLLRLKFLDEGAAITLGEPVMTTEEGGLIPAGIAIGSVFKQDDQGYLVKPVRSLSRSEYVRVVLTE